MDIKRLGEICDIVSGGTPSRINTKFWDGGIIPWIKIGNIKEKYVSEADEYITQAGLEGSSAKMLPKGTILYTIFATLGEVGILTIDACTNQAIAGITIKNQDEVLTDYLYYYLKSKKSYVNNLGRGVAQNNINMSILRNLEVPLPALSVQRQTVTILDRTAKVVKYRQQQLQELDDLVKARFVELFGNPISNPMKWDTYQLEECLERIDNGKSFICSDKPRAGDTPAILKLSAATYGDYRPNENKALLDESLFVESAEVHAGDLLFTRKNTPELVGTAAYVQNTPSKLMMPDLIFRLVPNEKVNAVFLWQLINCKEFRPVIQAISGGSAKSMSNISKERLGKIKVICPPRELQDSLIPFVEQTDKSKLTISGTLTELETLKDSLMQQYFG